MSEIVEILGNKLYGLVHPYALDGRVGSHPPDFEGWASMNSYLLLEADRALLYNTGYSVHQDALIEQLEHLVGERALALVVSRVEFASMCNARPIADRFTVEVVHQEMKLDVDSFLNFRPQFPIGTNDGLVGVRQSGLTDTDVWGVRENGLTEPNGIKVDRAGRRRLEAVETPLRLLPMEWRYDFESGTLFTGDMFCWCTRDHEDGPWVESDTTASATNLDVVYRSLIHNRYWWLAGADTAPLISALDRVFANYKVDVIAPDHGAIICGAAVATHTELLQQVLRDAGKADPVGVAAGRWKAGRTNR